MYLGPGRCRRVPDLRDQSQAASPKKLDPSRTEHSRPRRALGWGVGPEPEQDLCRGRGLCPGGGPGGRIRSSPFSPGAPHGSRAWRPNLETTMGKRQQGGALSVFLSFCLWRSLTQSKGLPHGKPCWVPTPGMASGSGGPLASGQQTGACRSGVAMGPGHFCLSILVLGYLYSAVRTQLWAGIARVWQVYHRQLHPIRLFEAAQAEVPRTEPFKLCGRRSVVPSSGALGGVGGGLREGETRRHCELSCLPALEQSTPGWLPCGVRDQSSCLRGRVLQPLSLWAWREVLVRGCLVLRQRA